MSDPAPNQDLPKPDIEVDVDVDNKPDKGEPPRGPGQNRGKDEEARENAPGQQKKDATNE